MTLSDETTSAPDVTYRPGGRPLILLVDGDAALCRSIRDALGHEFDAIDAPDGCDGMRLALQARPTLVVTDVADPGGLELVREFAAHPELANIPIIALAPRADDAARIGVLREGAADWLVKPFAPDELRVRVRNLINARLLEASVRRLHGELARRERELVEADRRRSAFLLRLAEQIKPSLDRILGQAAALADNRVARGLLRDGERIATLLESVSEFAELEAGRVELDLAPIDLDGLLDEVLARARESARDSEVAVARIAPRALGAALADSAWLEQALEHLLGNAIRFTPAGGQVALHAERVDAMHARHALPGFETGRRLPLALPPGNGAEFIAISIYDSGAGIDEDRLERLFVPLGPDEGGSETEHDSSRTTGPGPGLGLAIVREIVALHGGAVAVTSDPGQGSCFTIWLPAAAADALPRPVAGRRAEARPAALLVLGGPDESDPDDARRARARDALRDQLQADGFELMQPTRAADADEALALLRERNPDLVAVELGSPALDGWSFLVQMRRQAASRGVPIVVTALDGSGRGFDCDLGTALVLQRPQNGVELNAELRGFGYGPGRTPRILVIDHDAAALARTAGDLRQAGYTALRALGGREGIELTGRFAPDLIVLAAQMPDVDGLDVIEALRRDPATAAIPVILIAPADPARRAPTRSGLVLRRQSRGRPEAGRTRAENRRAPASATSSA